MRVPSVLLLVVLMLALPSAASAAVRQAVPAGGAASGPCDAGAPCTLAEAVAGAATDDTVRVASGTYDLPATLDATVGGLAIEADSAVAPPLLQWSGSANGTAVRLSGIGQTLRGVRVQGTVNGAALLVRADDAGSGATLERVQVRNEGTGTAVALRDAVLRDSVATSIGDGSLAVIGSGTITGSTLIAQGAGASALYTSTLFFAGSSAVTVRNSILRGDVSGWDAEVLDDLDLVPGSSATLDVDFSSYGAGRLRTATTSGTGVATVTPGPANVTTVGPLLAGLPGGLDVRQLRGSPTIDAGTAAVTTGAIDIDGDPRVYGAATDIGADEYLPPPLATIQTVVVDDTSAAVTGLITPRGSDTTWRMEYGSTNSYGSGVAGGTVPKTSASQSVSARLTGLRQGTTYHVRLVGESSRGTTFGPDTTFRTTSTPGGETLSAARPTLSGVRLVRGKVRRGKVAGLKLKSSGAGTLEVVFSRLQRGRRKGKACVAASKRCTAAIRVGGLARKVLPGENGPLPIVTTKLRRARYRLTLTVVGANGKRSKPVSVILRVT